MRISRLQRALSVAGAIAVHAAVGVVLLWQPPERDATAAGVGGVEVSLGPSGGAPGTVEAVMEVSETATLAPETAAEMTPPESVEAEVLKETVTATPPAEPAIEMPPQTVAVEAPVETAPETPLEETAIETPAEQATEIPTNTTAVEALELPSVPPVAVPLTYPKVERPQSAAIEQTAQIDPAEAATTEPAPAVPPELVTAEAADIPPPPAAKPPAPKRAAPRPSAPVSPAPRSQAPAPVRETTPKPAPRRAVQEVARPPTTAGVGGKAGTEVSPQAGSGAATSGGGNPAATADYMATLQAWLERHKEYPRRAQMRRQEGTALLYFIMDRSGRVLDYRLQRSSGHALLDREVRAMIERAQPLPKMPPEMRQSRLELVVPVQFFLR